MVLVGDTWDQKGIDGATLFPNLSEQDTARIGQRSRIVLCKHRTNVDIGGFPAVLPASVNRGYIECGYRSLVMIDADRPESSFTDEVERYDGVESAAQKITHYLAHPAEIEAMADKAFARAAEFTHKARMHFLVNAFRSTRFNVKVA